MRKIQSSGGEVIYPVELVHPNQNGIGKAMDIIFGNWNVREMEALLTSRQTTNPVMSWPRISKRETIQT
ncbi:hypothetical protein F5Y10DRAFT_258364 [Nemania abortiva]|nr:hypothetical protein F5Y10DRAFT_258364 [Nemania abortiva]